MKRIYIKNLIEALEDLSNYNFQKIAWFPNNKNLCSSYVEDVIAVFDGSGLDAALSTGEVIFDIATDKAFRDLEESTNAIDEFTQSDEEILDSPEMAIVREKAAIALALVKASVVEGNGTIKIIE